MIARSWTETALFVAAFVCIGSSLLVLPWRLGFKEMLKMRKTHPLFFPNRALLLIGAALVGTEALLEGLRGHQSDLTAFGGALIGFAAGVILYGIGTRSYLRDEYKWTLLTSANLKRPSE